MNATSASHAEALPATAAAPPAASSSSRVLVWDAPVRVFHWLAVLSFFGAWITAESERWRLLHVTLGYTLAALVAFRVVWGLVGTRHARFANFVRGPGAVMRYLRSLFSGRPEHHAGHNPAGALAIVGLLLLSALLTFTGWATYNEIGGGEWAEELHEGLANAMMALVGVHVAGVVISSWLHRDNLVCGMVTGWKAGTPAEAIRSAWRSVAALMIAAVIGFWGWQWQQSPIGGAPTGGDHTAAIERKAAPGQDDDD